MNYRHAFHAGGFADVIKHIVLVRMLAYLQEKQAPFRVIDTHAGAGRYDLTGEEARRSGEWLTGIARVMQARFSENALPLLTPYLDIVRAFNAPGRVRQSPVHGFDSRRRFLLFHLSRGGCFCGRESSTFAPTRESKPKGDRVRCPWVRRTPPPKAKRVNSDGR